MQKIVNSRNHGLVLFNPFIGPISGATTLSHSGPGSDANEGVLSILQTSPSDCLLSKSGHSLGGTYLTAEKQSVYSTVVLADWTKFSISLIVKNISISYYSH